MDTPKTESGHPVTQNQQGEDVMILQRLATFIQDAIQMPALRAELQAVKERLAVAQRQVEDLKAELELEKEAHASTNRTRTEVSNNLLAKEARLRKLQHSFDTLSGIIQSALADAKEVQQAEERPVQEAPRW